MNQLASLPLLEELGVFWHVDAGAPPINPSSFFASCAIPDWNPLILNIRSSCMSLISFSFLAFNSGALLYWYHYALICEPYQSAPNGVHRW